MAPAQTSRPHPHLLAETDGPVRTLTLDRPDQLNAQTPSLWRALEQEAESLPESVRVVVLRGSGPAFSAGLDRGLLTPGGVEGEEDIPGLAARGADVLEAAIAEYQRGFTAWTRCPAVVVARVHGHAIGAGFQLALAADLRVVGEDARFAMRETSLGLVPDLGGTAPLVRLVGPGRALEICATGRVVTAQEALRIGLANEVVPTERLDAATSALVDTLLAAPEAALRALKPLLQSAAWDAAEAEAQLGRERRAQVGLIMDLLRATGGRS
jgi:enoyl-CoA hydratase/carnithine racemase